MTSNDTFCLPALQIMVQELCTATSSMTSIPKSLKFLQPHYPLLKVMYEKFPGTIAKSTTNNQGRGGITRCRMSRPCYDR